MLGKSVQAPFNESAFCSVAVASLQRISGRPLVSPMLSRGFRSLRLKSATEEYIAVRICRPFGKKAPYSPCQHVSWSQNPQRNASWIQGCGVSSGRWTAPSAVSVMLWKGHRAMTSAGVAGEAPLRVKL